MPSSSILGLKMAFLLKKAVFSPNVELEGIARQVVEASRLGSCACFGNWGRNRGGYNFQIFSWLTLLHILHPRFFNRCLGHIKMQNNAFASDSCHHGRRQLVAGSWRCRQPSTALRRHHRPQLKARAETAWIRRDIFRKANICESVFCRIFWTTTTIFTWLLSTCKLVWKL